MSRSARRPNGRCYSRTRAYNAGLRRTHWHDLPRTDLESLLTAADRTSWPGPNGGASLPVWWGARRRWVSTLAGQERVSLGRSWRPSGPSQTVP